jgi:hypothetical protein
MMQCCLVREQQELPVFGRHFVWSAGQKVSAIIATYVIDMGVVEYPPVGL